MLKMVVLILEFQFQAVSILILCFFFLFNSLLVDELFHVLVRKCQLFKYELPPTFLFLNSHSLCE